MDDKDTSHRDHMLRLLELHAAGSSDMQGDGLADRLDRWRISGGALQIEETVDAVVGILSSLQVECSDWRNSGVPSAIAYPVSEILGRLTAVPLYGPGHPDLVITHRYAWRVATAWTALMTGDIEDLVEHIRWEEAARFA